MTGTRNRSFARWLRSFGRTSGSPDRFLDLISAQLLLQDIEVLERDPEGPLLRVKARRDLRSLDLRAAYQMWSEAWPWERARVVEHVAGGLALGLLSPPPGRWSEIRRHLFPHVRDRFFLEVIRLNAELEDREYVPIPHRRLTEHLCVVPAIDHPHGLQLVTDEDLQTWGVDLEGALAVAIENLRAISAQRLVEERPGVYVGPWGDSHDAARIMIDDLFRDLDLDGDAVALIPNRLSLIVAGAANGEALAASFDLAERRAEMAQPISCTPVIRRWPSFEPLALADHHPAYAAWRRLCLIDQLLRYEPQRSLLENVLEKRHEDIKVARCRIMENHESGELKTHCVWNRGLVSLLPRANRVALFDRDQPENEGVLAIVPWVAIEKHCQKLLQPTEHYPVRFRVDQFPDESTIEAMVSEFGTEVFPKS